MKIKPLQSIDKLEKWDVTNSNYVILMLKSLEDE